MSLVVILQAVAISVIVLGVAVSLHAAYNAAPTNPRVERPLANFLIAAFLYMYALLVAVYQARIQILTRWQVLETILDITTGREQVCLNHLQSITRGFQH